MKSSFRYICSLVITITLLAGCKKESVSVTTYASLRIVNTVSGGVSARLNSYVQSVSNNSNVDYTFTPGNTDIYVWPTTDSLQPYYVSSKTAIEERGLYTLLLGGTPAGVDGIFLKESFPYRTDSTAAIRFVHLAPGGPAVNVTLSTSTTVNEFSNVAYKGVTDFKYLPATNAIASYTFQVRQVGTNAILSTITMSGTALASFVPRFRFVTLVFRGKVGGTPAPGISRVNHY